MQLNFSRVGTFALVNVDDKGTILYAKDKNGDFYDLGRRFSHTLSRLTHTVIAPLFSDMGETTVRIG